MAARKGPGRAHGIGTKWKGKKPLSLLKKFRSKMEKNLPKLDALIKRREAAGEK